jgi:tRNA dimethylallyltransferase
LNLEKQAIPLPHQKELIIILGPTAVGKTAYATELAGKLKTEIISADSRQFYRELEIGTAKPGRAELSRVKHHFINSLSIHDEYNVARYETEVIGLLHKRLFPRYDKVVMVGGSGLYIDAVCYGVDEFPDVDPELRSRLKEAYRLQGVEFLREKVKQLDPAYFEEVDTDNPNRLMRAIEVSLQTGEPYSKQRRQEKKKREFTITKIGLELPRDLLFSRIEARVGEMVESGLIEEAKRFYPLRRLNALNTVGYKELFSFFNGEIDLDRAIEDIKTNTRRYAKRQLTWFKRGEDIEWVSNPGFPTPGFQPCK